MTGQLKRSIRSLWHQRLYSLLNLSGLAIGMAAAMLITLWVQNELRFDRYHPQASNIWRVETNHLPRNATIRYAGSPLKTTAFQQKIPGILSMTQLKEPDPRRVVLHHGTELYSEDKVAFVGPGWFNMFDYSFVEGSAAGFGDRPNDIILTESLARKIFGEQPAIGSVLRIDSIDFSVYAVLCDPRTESSFRQRVLLPLEAYLREGDHRKNDASWNYCRYTSFVKLHPDVRPGEIEIQLDQELFAATQDSTFHMQLGPLTGIHFDQNIKGDLFEKGSLQMVWTFALIGLLILGMAAINYISLTTARAQTRAREVGIRKLVGASKTSLFGQFLQETILLAGLAGIISIILVHSALPWFNTLADNHFELEWTSPLPWLLLGSGVVCAVLLSGIYPALLMAGFKPMMVLRGEGHISGKRSVFRQGLVVFQFAVSVALIICTIIVGQQRSYIQNKDMGYDRAQIFTFEMAPNFLDTGASNLEAFEQTLRQSTAVEGLSRASESPIHIERKRFGPFKLDGLPLVETSNVTQLNADIHFGQLFDIQMAEGRWFEPGNKSDFHNVILNETAARQLGLPQPWLGQHFGFDGFDGNVIGLIRDFHFLPLYESIPPLVIFNEYDWRGYFFVKTRPGQSKQALETTERLWKQWYPEQPFEYSFLDENFNRMYRAEQRTAILFNLFAGIAIFLSCLGLLGLATFMAVQRTKEIGIRKVLGASIWGITTLLTRDFLKLILIAFLLAAPVAYWIMAQWLGGFAYRIEMRWWMFGLSGLLALILACSTVGFQSVRAALADPVKSLRSE